MREPAPWFGMKRRVKSGKQGGLLTALDTVGNTATLALHVLTGARFGVSYSFGQGV